MKFDLTSDLHLDFWVGVTGCTKKQQASFHRLLAALIPETCSDTLLIAGDLGHYNHQNKIFLEVAKQVYKNIVIVSGNHDLYMVSHGVCKRFNHSSIDRLNDMIETSRDMGIHYLQGNTVTIDGAVIGGTGMWYDNSYARNKFGYTNAAVDSLWQLSMNDAKLIYWFDRYDWFAQEYQRMESIISESDVIMSHICPCSDVFPKHRREVTSTFYQFDGSKLFNQTKQNALWCYGHSHDTYSGEFDGHLLHCNPLGYPSDSIGYEWTHKKFPASRKFKPIEVFT